MKAFTLQLIKVITSLLLPAITALVILPPMAQQVLAQDASIVDRRAEADRLFQGGIELRQREEYDVALETFQAALRMYEEVDDYEGQADTLNQLGNVYLSLNQHDRASDHYQQALDLRQQDKPDFDNDATSAAIGPQSNERIIFQPPDISTSGPVTPSGTRGGPIIEIPVALIPDTNYGRTTEPYPTLFIYLTEEDIQRYQGLKMTFRLLQSDESELPVPIYESTRTYPEGIGVFGIRLEELENIEPLALGEQYRWQIIIDADPQYPSRAIVLENVIERVEPAFPELQSIEIALADQPYIYVREGLWYDALAAFFELRQQEPTNSEYVTDLQEFLASVGLKYIDIDNFVGYWSDEQQNLMVNEQQSLDADEPNRSSGVFRHPDMRPMGGPATPTGTR